MRCCANSSWPRVNHIVENSNGVYIAAGEAKYGWEGYQRKPWIMAIDKDGNVLWAKTYDSLDHLAFGDVVATQDGGLLFLVVGAKDEFGTEGPALLKTDAEGNPQWCKWYKNDVGYAKIVPADDGYYIVGSKWGRVDEVFGINRSEWLWYGSIFKVDLEGNIPYDTYEVEEWQVDPPQTWSNVTYEKIEISHYSPEEWDPTFVDSDMPVTLQNEPKVATVFEYAPNKPPVANFTYSPENPVVGQAVTFDASGSYDPDGSIVSYEWDFGDGNITNTTEEKIKHSYSESGSYKVTLTVTDDKGATSSTTKIITVSGAIFDCGEPKNPYPSIMGTHKGTIKPNHTIIATKLYTYACAGTGGHTEYARIWNETWEANATWEGYAGDWHNISFDKTVVLLAGETYFYEIRTGSYPQIHHTNALLTANGWINCTEFKDTNGRVYYDWIPAIKLF